MVIRGRRRRRALRAISIAMAAIIANAMEIQSSRRVGTAPLLITRVTRLRQVHWTKNSAEFPAGACQDILRREQA